MIQQTYFTQPDLDKIITARVLMRMGEDVLRFFIYNFSNEGYDTGTFKGWKDKKFDNNKPLLYDTGKLKSSFKITYSDKSFTLMNIAEYAKWLNDGVASRNLPARPILYYSEKVNKIINDIVIEETKKYYSNPNNYMKK